MMTKIKFNTVPKGLAIGLFLILGIFLIFPATGHAKKTLNISINPAGAGTVSPGTSTSVNNWEVVNISATPNACYEFVNWSGTSVSRVADRYDATTTISMGNANRSITANFTRTCYVITASAGTGGSISPSGSVTVNSGTSRTFTITPSTGYNVSSVLVDGGAVSIPAAGGTYTFSNVSSDHTISASFGLQPFTIAASAGTGGTVSPSGDIALTYGASQSFDIMPSAGHTVTSVLVDGAAVSIPVSGGTYTFTNVTENHTIAASFTLNTYTITASAGTGGSISPSGTTIVNYGATQIYTITASSGYVVDTVTVDGEAIELTSGNYTFSNINANHTISATFRSTGGGNGGGTSDIPGCSASTYTSYSSGFNAADFTMTNTDVENSKIVLRTGVQSIEPENIVIPFTQEVSVTFLYEGAGNVSDFGWMLKSDAVNADGSFKGWTSIA
ncbi:MAG: hypothetical protein WA151_13490, partial [Desulfatirhabdiaceae bacterium]